MPHDVRLSEAAIADLVAIGEWIGTSAGDDVADAYVRRIEAQCATLAHFPNRGTPHEELEPGLRSIPAGRRAIIYYRVTGDNVDVVRVLHAGRDAAGALGTR